MSLRLILIHFIYRVVFGVGIAAIMWAGGHLVYSRTYPLYAMSKLKQHPDNATGVSDIQWMSQEQPGTLQAVPLHRSNAAVAIASHRNKFANELQNLRVGDEIQVLTPEGIFGYFVTTIEIVDPSESRGLDAPGPSQLTISTTYSSPLGSAAPQRFIVRARPQREMKN
jgi:Sortase (surface protein transpeptidase)